MSTGTESTTARPLRVSELPTAERPHARLTHHGAARLTAVELLALLIGGDDALTVANDVLARNAGSLRRVAADPVGMLQATRGIGRKHAAQIHAALELGRRMMNESHEAEPPRISSSRDMFRHFAYLADLGQEEMHVAILDAQHRLRRDVTITRGILNSSLVHPREVFREAIAERACAIILVHNHPSGDPTPSPDDRMVTQQLVAAGRLLDIPVHDHVIVGAGRYTSFAEAGLL